MQPTRVGSRNGMVTKWGETGPHPIDSITDDCPKILSASANACYVVNEIAPLYYTSNRLMNNKLRMYLSRFF